jgi:hypothetical protein
LRLLEPPAPPTDTYVVFDQSWQVKERNGWCRLNVVWLIYFLPCLLLYQQ